MDVLLTLTKTIMRKLGLNLWVLGGCAIILCAVFSGPKVVIHHGMASELMGLNEFPVNCGPYEGGFSGQTIAEIPGGKEYAINSVFITAAGLNRTSNSPADWADAYYGNPSNYGYNQYNGTVDPRDLWGNWGAQTFSPMAPIMADICMIGQSMENEHEALLIENGGGLWAVCTFNLLPDSTSMDPNYHPTSYCEYTKIDPSASQVFWYTGSMIFSTTDEFMDTIITCNLYLVDSN